MTDDLDLLVVGSGVAGLSTAVRAATVHGLRVGVHTKGPIDRGTTRWAQGGVAAVLSEGTDSTDLHLADTLAAGADLCDVDAVRVLVEDGPDAVRDLMTLGAEFDRDAQGRLELAREGGHSASRVVHAGGAATGREIERALVAAVGETAAAVHEGSFALDLLVEDGRCVGIRSVDGDGRVAELRARNVVLTTGGAGQMFAVTTTPLESTGDGVAMALRAGAAVADVEFVQFHPTALHTPGSPKPLLTEALRGDGALLRDTTGERFIDELLPRDQVSRAMTRRMIELGVDHLWLDATMIDGFSHRFPTIAKMLAERGLDPSRDWLPIAPAAHYLCGGVVTDLDGATSIPGLWAAGEVACTGVHGANRLASNSLLEGLVFGPRVVDAIARGVDGPVDSGAMRAAHGSGGRRVVDWTRPEAIDPGASGRVDIDAAREELQRSMTIGAGVVRDAESLAATASVAERVVAAAASATGVAAWELMNLATVAAALLAAATTRTESRGAHTRDDHPSIDPELALRLVVV